jgi:hypothetical protein
MAGCRRGLRIAHDRLREQIYTSSRLFGQAQRDLARAAASGVRACAMTRALTQLDP